MTQRDDGVIETAADTDPVARAAHALRQQVHIDASFDARVMAEIRRPRRSAIGALLHWLAEPRAVRISPLGALVGALCFALVIASASLALYTRASSPPASAVASSARAGGDVVQPASLRASTAARVVQFVFVAPRASSVSLVGDFNDWDPRATPLRSTNAGGVWSIEVPLQPGRHLYSFVVDGTTWHPDPAAPPEPGDDFGRPNSVVTVSEGSL